MDLFEEWIMKDNELIEYALTDKSYKSVYSKEHHENLPKNKTNFELATYGDAILKMCIMEILYDNKIEKPTEEKKKYESNKALVLIAEKYDLIKILKLMVIELIIMTMTIKKISLKKEISANI